LAASSDIPGVVLTDHGSHYLNKWVYQVQDFSQFKDWTDCWG
jgi:hypothetical protein